MVDDGGGQTSTGQGYQLSGTIGQPDAGRATGGSFTLNSGFWPGLFQSWQVYIPLLRR